MPIPVEGIAPTPSKEYKLSEHQPTTGAKPNSALMDALNRHAGNATAPKAAESTPEVAVPIVDDKPAPHVKFVSADDRPVEPETSLAVPTDDKPVKEPEKAFDPVKATGSQLRERYESALAETKRLKDEMATTISERDLTKKEAAAFRDKIKAQEDKLTSLSAAEQRAKDLEAKYSQADEQLRVTNYVQHPEFHEKFTRPLADAVTAGRELMSELVVSDESGNQRTASAEDFDAVCNAPNLSEAMRRAETLFGERAANVVLAKRDRVMEARRSYNTAMKEANTRAVEWQQQQATRASEARNAARTAFAKKDSELQDRYSSVYKPKADDKEAVEARSSGESLAKLAIDGKPVDMDHETYLESIAKVYNRAASFPMQELAIHRLQRENETLKSKLAGYEKSTPDVGGRLESSGKSGGSVKNGVDSLDQQMHDSLARRAKARH